MRKIYSLVLMAAALLVGTNAWAKDFTSGSGSDLQDAIYAIMDGTESDPVIKLTQPVTLTDPIWIGTKNLNDPYRSITLDLNGKDITMNATNAKVTYNMFVLTHGELKVINTSATEAQLYLSGSGHINSDVIFMTGSYRASGWNDDGTAVTTSRINTRTSGWCTHLEIGERVIIKIYDNGTGINVNNCLTQTACNGFTIPDGGINYTTQLAGSNGFVFGARVDLKGHIVIEGTSCTDTPLKGKTYGIKVNGTVQSPSNIATTGFSTLTMNGNTVPYLQNYASHMGEIELGDPTHKLDTTDAPFVHIYPQASVITVNKGERSAPVYASGYAKWMIEGTCKGKTGIYISSGAVTMNNANVSSNAEVYHEAISDGGAQAAGSGVDVNSRSGSYSGEVQVTVSGDTKIEGTTGYAVEEVVNTTPTPKIDPVTQEPVTDPETGEPVMEQNTKVQEIVINGGTFEGGNKGAIAVSEETVTDEDAQVVIYGGNVNGENQVGTSGDIDDITPSGYHNTEVTNADGTTTVVISQGSEPATDTANPTTSWDFIEQHSDAINPSSYKWTKIEADEITSGVVTLDELQIISGYKEDDPSTVEHLQELTIRNNATLNVKRLIMNEYARIIVEAGGKLIVTGSQGINAPIPENIVLKSDATNKATFVISPAVTSNKQPMATVEYTPTTYMKADGTKVWQRFTSPLDKVTENPTNNAAELAPIDYVTGESLLTYASYYDGATGWVNLTKWKQLRAFRASAISNNTPEGTNVTYTFKGQLAGNVTDSIAFWNPGWNYYGNTFIAPMSTKSLLAALATARVNGIDVDGTLQMWNVNNQKYMPLNTTSTLFGEGDVEIPALHCFVVKLRSGNSADFDINYSNTVYDYAIHPENYAFSAPARLSSETSTVRINIESADGIKDAVCIVENGSFTADYDDSADAEKLMEDGLNFYISDENNNLSILASDNILGSLLTLQTTDEIDYTLSFDYVRGEVYALRDNMTNAVVLMNEGAIYNFTAQPNATLEGRFQIVSRQEMPTAVETVEETINAPKAIYTVMGQYVGETTDWNNLPAGVYVVDGVKVIK